MASAERNAVVQALLRHRPDPGTVVRAARSAAGWSQSDLARRCGYSASQISRWETGRMPLRDVATMQTLAAVLDLPPETFGLAGDDTASAACRSPRRRTHTLNPTPAALRGEDEIVRRREFLQAASGFGTALAWPGTVAAQPSDLDPAELLAQQLGEVLLGPTPSAEPATVDQLHHALRAARRDFAACRYLPLATRLPELLTTAEATATAQPERARQHLLAGAYNLTTRALIKLEASGLEWVSADRGLRAAHAADEPLTLAEAQRLVASAARRAGHHDRAQNLTLAAAEHLHTSSTHPPPQHLAMCGTLYCSAGYAAARAGDRDRAEELLTEAQHTAQRLDSDPTEQRTLAANTVSHRVSAAYLLGDAGAGLVHARSLPLAAIPTTERRARLLVDAAMCYAQWDAPRRALHTLLAAERTAPQEVRTRNAARRLVTTLMTQPSHTAMPGLPALAARVHAPI